MHALRLFVVSVITLCALTPFAAKESCGIFTSTDTVAVFGSVGTWPIVSEPEDLPTEDN